MALTKLPFFSSGLRIDADLHLPDGPTDTPPPVLVACSGYQGQKVIHPERFARAFTPLGYAVLAFDYRGFGLSEGERGRLVPQEWVEDVRAGIDRLSTVEDVDAQRLGLIGWGLGGGVVVAEAAEDERVSAVACCNGIGDGLRSTRNTHDEDSWEDLVARVRSDRGRRSSVGRSEVTDPWDIVRLDLDDSTDQYAGDELTKAPGFGTGVTLESADYLLRFSPERVVDRIAPRPLLIIHGAQNALYQPVEAHSLLEHADGRHAQLELLEGAGHTEWMLDTHPTFQRVVTMLDEFFTNAFTAGSAPATPGTGDLS